MLRTKNFVVFCALTNTHHLATRGEIIGLSRISWGKWDYRRYESCVMEIYTYIWFFRVSFEFEVMFYWNQGKNNLNIANSKKRYMIFSLSIYFMQLTLTIINLQIPHKIIMMTLIIWSQLTIGVWLSISSYVVSIALLVFSSYIVSCVAQPIPYTNIYQTAYNKVDNARTACVAQHHLAAHKKGNNLFARSRTFGRLSCKTLRSVGLWCVARVLLHRVLDLLMVRRTQLVDRDVQGRAT